MINKGIILAGGTGSRLKPVTNYLNKHLLPINDKPMVYYPLSVLMLSGIKKINILIKEEDKSNFQKCIGSTENLGIDITYSFERESQGIPNFINLCKDFIGNSNICVILGDNFFYGQALSNYLNNIKKNKSGTLIFTYPVSNTSQYGILEETNNKKKFKLVEKPKKTFSNLAITGLYVFDNKIKNYINKLKKSKRGEFEIIDLLNLYLKNKNLNICKLGRGASWFDCGTFSSLGEVTSLVAILEKKQSFKIACLEEIAYRNNWINKKNIQNRIKFYGKTEYSEYLSFLIKKL